MTRDEIAALIQIEWEANPANSDDGFRLFRAVVRDRAWHYGTDAKGQPYWMAPHSAGKDVPTEEAARAAAETDCRQTVLAEIEAVIPGLIPAVRTLAAENERLRAELSAALGYMRNAMINLDTGAPKRTAVATLFGGIARLDAAINPKD